jgi:hypothetical protein
VEDVINVVCEPPISMVRETPISMVREKIDEIYFLAGKKSFGKKRKKRFEALMPKHVSQK